MIRALNPLEYLRARRSRQQAVELDTLFGAAIIGDEAGIIRLLRQGLDPNFQDTKGESGLHWAAAHGSVGIVRLLLEEGANPNIMDKRNASPLHIAADAGQVEVTRMLLNGGSQVNCRDRGGSTPLHWAVSSGKKESVEVLLEKGADAEAKDSGGVTPLMLAAHYGRAQIAALLLQKGALVNPKAEYANTPLHSAAESGHLNIVDLLISKGADVNRQDESGFTALHLASKRGHRDIVKKLLQHGSDKDVRNEHGQTPEESTTSPELKHLLRSSNSTGLLDHLKKHQRSASGPQLPLQKLAMPDLTPVDPEPKKMSGQVKLASFLKELQLEQYVSKFLEEEFDYETLKEVTEDDLIQMGVKIGSRRKLLAALRAAPMAGHHGLSASSAEKNWTIDYAELHLMYEAGQGFYGAVYKGMWNNAEVAVKKIFPSKIQSMSKWLTEVEFLSTLRHPNVVVFYGACTSPPDICIVTEWVPRGSLHRVLAAQQANLDIYRLLSFATDIARGLAFLHMHDPPIIHRDLKSENLLVTNNWRIKLTDFGLSRFKDPTYNYTHPQHPFDVTIAAPEVLDQNHLSEKADIYSYALIALELHTRKKPFEGKNPHWVAKGVLNEKMRPDVPTAVAVPMKDMIELAWHQEHQKRPTAKEIIARLEEMHRTESLKPATSSSDSGYRKKLADSCDDGTEISTGSFIELDKKDENNYVLGSH